MNLELCRHKMVDEQLIPRGISNHALLETMRRIPRHDFVPADELSRSYLDSPVPIGEGQTMSQPYMVAVMTQWLNLDKSKSVLEIGTGSGYQTAILAELSGRVHTVERIRSLANRADRILKQFNYKNIEIFIGDGSHDVAGSLSRYDAVIITAASPAKPEKLLRKVNTPGRLVVPVGDRERQTLKCYIKTRDDIIEHSICGCVFVPLIGKYGFHDN